MGTTWLWGTVLERSTCQTLGEEHQSGDEALFLEWLQSNADAGLFRSWESGYLVAGRPVCSGDESTDPWVAGVVALTMAAVQARILWLLVEWQWKTYTS